MRDLASKLKQKITDRDATIGVIGLGYVGLPLAVEFAEVGFRVTGIDVDERKVKTIQRGRSHIQDVPSKVIAGLVKSGNLQARTRYKGCGKFDAIFICVPTPLRKTKDPDISYIVSSVTEQIASEVASRASWWCWSPRPIPGTTEEVVRPRLEAGGELKAGQGLLPGVLARARRSRQHSTHTTHNTPKVVGGTTRGLHRGWPPHLYSAGDRAPFMRSPRRRSPR